LFTVDDKAIVNDLSEVIHKIREIIRLSEYKHNANDQSVVEICITRVTSTIRETGSIERHADALVVLLESCLCHSLAPSIKDEDPPHAKIASDVLSCIFLNYSKRRVMELALPVAVKFLHKGNRELSRNLSSYLSLAAINNSDLIAQHVQPIIDSFISGNYSLARVLPQVYAVNQEAIHGHVMALASLLPLCDTPEKVSLLSLLGPIARNRPSLLEASLPQLCDCLVAPLAVPATLQLLAEMATYKASLLNDYVPRIREAAEDNPSVVCLAAQVLTRLGHLNVDRGQEALDFIVYQITKAENHNIPSLIREVAALCNTYPVLLNDRLVYKLESYVEGAPSVAKTIYLQMKTNLAAQRNGQVPKSPDNNITSLKVNRDGTTNHRLSLPLQGFAGALSSPANNSSSNNRSSLGGFVNVGNVSVPISVASAVFNGTPVYNSQGIPVLLTFGPGGLNITNANSTGSSAAGRVVGSRTKQTDASKSTPRLTPPTPSSAAAAAMNRSMSWINAVHMSTNRLSPSPAGPVLHKNIARFGSSHQMGIGAAPYGPSREAHGPGIHNPNQGRGLVLATRGSRGSLSTNRVPPGGPATNTISSSSAMRSVSGSLTTMKEDPEGDMRINNLIFGHNNASRDIGSPSPIGFLPTTNRIQNQTPVSMVPSSLSSLAPSPPPITQNSGKIYDDLLEGHHKASMNTLAQSQSSLSFSTSNAAVAYPTAVVRRNHATISNLSGNPNGMSVRSENMANTLGVSQRISVFEPYPMNDAVKHFCDKHLDKIKAYMERLMARLPLPVKCTIEERRSKKHAKVHFTCQGKSEYCLYGKSLFALKTKHPRLWIHLMFLALQARSSSALSTRDASVSSLKNCWDILKCDNKSFLNLVMSAFPSTKDQDNLMHELQQDRFFDVFEFNGAAQQWNCFLCNHPERAPGFMEENHPLMEGQLKEKKNKWLIFRRWRTRYFTLSGAHLSYRESKLDQDATPIEINQIRSVKVSRPGRSIPKAFEIFTSDKTYVLKAKDGKNAEEWVQCLSIAVASSHARDTPPSRPVSQHFSLAQSQFGLRTTV